MKKLFAVIFCLLLTAVVSAAAAELMINQDNFPDANFVQYLLGSGLDEDGSGGFSDSELEKVYSINCSGKEIEDLTGLAYFPNLRYLYCGENKLDSLNVSQNTQLRILSCAKNNLAVLDVHLNTMLETLYCYENPLASLYTGKNTELQKLACFSTGIEELDLSSNTKLKELDCVLLEMTDLDLSHNPALEMLQCTLSKLTSLDFSNNPALKHVECGSCDLGEIVMGEHPDLIVFECESNHLTSLDLSGCGALKKIYCQNNELTSLKVGKSKDLNWFHCYHNQLTDLDITGCDQIIDLVQSTTPDTHGSYYEYEGNGAQFYYDKTVKLKYDAVTTVTGPLTFQDLRYSFANSGSVFKPGQGLDKNKKIPSYIYDKFAAVASGQSSLLYSHAGVWGGSCHGMISSSILYNTSSGLRLSDLGVSKVSQIQATTYANAYKMSSLDIINFLQIAYPLETKERSLPEIYRQIEAGIRSGKLQTLSMWGMYKGKVYGHSVLPYKIEYKGKNERKVYVYNPNYPDDQKQVVTFTLNAAGEATGWHFMMGKNNWGTGYSGNIITTVAPDNLSNIWNIYKNKSKSASRWYTSSGNTDYKITDSSGNVLGVVSGGNFTSKSSDLSELKFIEQGEGADPVIISKNADFRVVNTGSGSLAVDTAGPNQGAFVKTSAGSVTFSIEDSSGKNTVVLGSKKNDTFDVTFYSGLSAAGSRKKVEISGKSEGAKVEVGMNGSDVVANNCTNVSVTVNGNPVDNLEDLGKNINFYKISLAFTEAYYTGKEIKPAVKVSGKKLTEGTDYKLTYKNNTGSKKEDTTASVVIKGTGKYTGTKTLQFVIKAPMNSIAVGSLKYKLSGSKATVTGPKSKSVKKLAIPDTVKANGKTYKVTDIKAGAFKGMKKLTTVTLGKNIKTIGKSAFQNCAKLKSITIKSKNLTNSSVKSNAFKGISKKATFKCPKGLAETYKKILLKKGAAKTCKFK